MCESYGLQYGTNFLSVMPTNLYGVNDSFDLEKSHLLPALIRENHLAKKIQKVVGFKGDLHFDTTKPDGTMRKVTDVSKLHDLGWKHSVDLEEGIEKMYAWYLKKMDE